MHYSPNLWSLRLCHCRVLTRCQFHLVFVISFITHKVHYSSVLINNMSSPGPEETSSSQLKAGHPPAVKAGGMRITQNKTPHPKDVKEVPYEDFTGLAGPSPVPSNPVSIAGAPNRGNADFTPEAAQIAHSPKPPAYVNFKPCPHIQQPRK